MKNKDTCGAPNFNHSPMQAELCKSILNPLEQHESNRDSYFLVPYTLVEEKMECKESTRGYVDIGKIKTIRECASMCDEKRVNGGAGILFTFGRRDGSKCHIDGCICWCMQEDKEGICDKSYTSEYNLYRANGKEVRKDII